MDRYNLKPTLVKFWHQYDLKLTLFGMTPANVIWSLLYILNGYYIAVHKHGYIIC